MSASRPTYRHVPTLRADVEMILTERTDRNGRQYFFGFVGGMKYFMTKDPAPATTWRLRSQSLHPGPDPDTPAEPTTGPHGGRIVRAVPERVAFVSGLPDRPRRGGTGL